MFGSTRRGVRKLTQTTDFAELSKEEKLEDAKRRVAEGLQEKLDAVKTLAAYDKLLDQLHSESATDSTPRRPLLFTVSPPDKFADLDETIPAVNPEYHLKANQAYNARVQFHTGAAREDFPIIGFRDQGAGLYTISGSGYEFTIADHTANQQENRDVLLLLDGAALRAIDNGAASAAKARVMLQVVAEQKEVHNRRRNKRAPRTRRTYTTNALLGDFEVRNDELYFRPGRIRLRLLQRGATSPLPSEIWRKLAPGDVVETSDFLTRDLRPTMTVTHSARGALIGPAWSNGNWMLAYDPGRSLPWIGLLADAIRSVWEKPEVKKAERLTTLSLDEPLQNAAQQFVSQKGRKLHGELLSGRQGPSTSASRCLVHLGCREWRDACACRMAAHDF